MPGTDALGSTSAEQDAVIRPVWWETTGGGRGVLRLIDQTRLPEDLVHVDCRTAGEVWRAIKTLQVRGAPAIGVAAAYGVVVGFDETAPDDRRWPETVAGVCDYLATSRPTAVNLFRALERMRRRAAALAGASARQAREALLAEAHAIRDEDAAMCRAIGEAGQHLIPEGAGVLTHCNAGALATSELGTALAVMYVARRQGRRFRVFVDETRPLLQGSRLTAWELIRAGVETTLICDGMAGAIMAQGRVQVVITGADRIAANGDTANKIGTYALAVLAQAHQVPFYVAAPSSTFDLTIRDGGAIPIEQRDAAEVRTVLGRPVAPKDVECFNPAFDVTPARLISGLVTDKGLIAPVTPENIRAAVG